MHLPRHASLTVVALLLAGVLSSLPGCPRQGEGERCDTRAGLKGEDSDCEDGLVCTGSLSLGENTSFCCPDPTSGVLPSHPACIPESSGVGGEAGAGGEGGSGGATSTGGAMASKTIGEPCGAAGECFSGSCTDGVCCSTPCTETCMTCALAGSIGTCSFVPAGEDPVDECPGTCDGAGQCQDGTGGGGSGGTGGTGGVGGMGGSGGN